MEGIVAVEKQVEEQFNPLLVGTAATTHFGGDFFGSLFPPLLPLLVDKYSISLALVGLMSTMRNLTGSFTQPLFGYLADRKIRGGLMAGGVLLSAIFMSAIPIAPNLGWLVLFLMMAGLGVSLSHPVAASLAARASGRRRGLGMGLYMAGGGLGFALGPFIVVRVAARFGLESVPYLVFFGVALAILLSITTRGIPAAVNARSAPKLREAFAGRGWSVALLMAIIMLRAVVSLSFGTYLPLYLTRRGASLVLAGSAITAFRLAGTAGGMLGGPLSDRIGRRRTLFWSSLLAIPFFWLSLRFPAGLGLAFLALAGAVESLANPSQVLIAQELVPQSIGTVSGLTIGFAWGLAGLSDALVGFLGQAIGLGPALSMVMVASLLLASLLVPALETASLKTMASRGG